MAIATLVRFRGSNDRRPFAGVRRALLMALLTLLVPVIGPARATDNPIEGGPGGGYFRDGCSGQYAAGFYFRSGSFVDGIGLKCAEFDAASGTFKKAWNKAYHGGSGGGFGVEAICPNTHFPSGIAHGYTRDGDEPRYLDYVKVFCDPVAAGAKVDVCLETGGGCWGSRDAAPNPGDLFWGPLKLFPFYQACPPGEAVIGLHGRSGVYVDAIGLICGPRPIAAVAAAPAPKPIRKLGKKKPAQPDLVMAAVADDVDVYDAPGGAGNVIGMLAKGSRVGLLEPCRDGWCHVKAEVPGGQGWVWGEFLVVGG
jgi:hypothetical protein